VPPFQHAITALALQLLKPRLKMSREATADLPAV